MNESRAILVDLLEIDHEFAGVVLGICEDFRTKKRDDVIGNDLHRLGLEVGIVDAEVGVEPVHLVHDKFARNEALVNPIWLV